MKQLWKILKVCLLVWGTFSLVAAIALALLIAKEFYYSPFGSGNRPSSKLASKQDVQFVLNTCKLSDWNNPDSNRIEEVVHSYVSDRSFTGDHLDAHAIRVTHLDASELIRDDTGFGGGWFRCDDLTGIAEAVVDFAAIWLPSEEIPWFPTIAEIRSPSTYVWIVGATVHGTYPNSAQMIFARPEERMVYWFSAKY